MAIARVQNSGKLSTSSGGNLSWTPGASPTLNNLLTYRTWGFTAGGIAYGTTDVKDSSGTPVTFTRTDFLNGAAFSSGLALYHLLVPSGLTTPVKDVNTGSQRFAIFDEWSGNDTTTPIDQHATNNGTAAGANSVSVNSGANAGLALAVITQDGGSNPESITTTGTSFSQDIAEQNGAVNPCGAADQRTTSVASQTGLHDSWTWSSNTTYKTLLATINAAGGGGGGTALPFFFSLELLSGQMQRLSGGFLTLLRDVAAYAAPHHRARLGAAA